MKRIAIAAFALLAAASSCSKGAERTLAVSGIVEATESRLGFQSAGRIADVTPHEGDRVEKGSAIARLDTSEADARRKQAIEQQRMVRTGARQERIDLQRAQVREAEASLAGVDAFLGNTTIAAPVEGIVTVRHHEPNETIAPGQPIVTMIDPNDRWVRVYIPENRLGAVRLGSQATIKSDTFHRTYPGVVSFIASEAEFTPKNVQTNEERVRLVYAVKVRITGDPAMELKPGMPVDVEVGLQ